MNAADAAAAADFGAPSARKQGRSAPWPYVPVIITTDPETGQERQSQVLGLAYATREEAVAAARGHIAKLRADLERRLGEPRCRALRRQYGVEQPS